MESDREVERRRSTGQANFYRWGVCPVTLWGTCMADDLNFRYTPRSHGKRYRRFEPHHREIVRRLAIGQQPKQIADDLGFSPATVNLVRNSEQGQAMLEALEERLDTETLQIAARIRNFAPECLDLIEAVIRGDCPDVSTRTRVQEAGRHLARAGFGEIRKEQSMQMHLSKQEVEAIKARSREASAEWDALEGEHRAVNGTEGPGPAT
jgi:hypothetical protein